jgi:hypothetical protein
MKRIAVGTSATPTRAEIRPFIGRAGPFLAGGAAIVSGTGKPASSFPSLCGSGAKRSAIAAMVGFEIADRLTGSSAASHSPKALGGDPNL